LIALEAKEGLAEKVKKVRERRLRHQRPSDFPSTKKIWALKMHRFEIVAVAKPQEKTHALPMIPRGASYLLVFAIPGNFFVGFLARILSTAASAYQAVR